MMTLPSKRFQLVWAMSLPLLGCAPKEYASLRPDRPNWLDADPSAAEHAKEMKEPAILPKTYYAAGRLFEQQGQIQKAILQYEQAIAAQRDYVPAYNRIGVLYGRMGRHAEAEDSLRKAVGMRPEWAFLRNNLAFEYMLQERWSDAEAELRNALKLNPGFARAHNNLGVVLAKQGRYDEALAEFQQAMPEADALYNLGMMHRNQNNYPEAAEAFERAIGLMPNFEEAKTQLAAVAPDRLRQMPSRPAATYTQPEEALAAAPAAAVETAPVRPNPPAPLVGKGSIATIRAEEWNWSSPARAEAPAPTPVLVASAPKAPQSDARTIAYSDVWLTAPVLPMMVEAAVPVLEAVAEETESAPAADFDPSILIVEAQSFEDASAVAFAEPDPCDEIDEVIESDAEVAIEFADLADENESLATAVAFEEPCVEKWTLVIDEEPIESLSDALGYDFAEPCEIEPAWEGGIDLVSWIEAALKAVVMLSPAGPELPDSPAAESIDPGEPSAMAMPIAEEALAALCDFSTDGAEHFRPSGDWRDWTEGFDASVVFLRIPLWETDLDEFASSSVLSMLD